MMRFYRVYVCFFNIRRHYDMSIMRYPRLYGRRDRDNEGDSLHLFKIFVSGRLSIVLEMTATRSGSFSFVSHSRLFECTA